MVGAYLFSFCGGGVLPLASFSLGVLCGVLCGYLFSLGALGVRTCVFCGVLCVVFCGSSLSLTFSASFRLFYLLV